MPTLRRHTTDKLAALHVAAAEALDAIAADPETPPAAVFLALRIEQESIALEDTCYASQPIPA